MEAFLANNKYKNNQVPTKVQVEKKEKLKAEEQAGSDSEAVLEPNLREFTLLISKLLFHLSQM